MSLDAIAWSVYIVGVIFFTILGGAVFRNSDDQPYIVFTLLWPILLPVALIFGVFVALIWIGQMIRSLFFT